MKSFLIDKKSVGKGAASYIKSNPATFAAFVLTGVSVVCGMVKDILIESETKDGPIEVEGKVE